jgi:hypothetical protein
LQDRCAPTLRQAAFLLVTQPFEETLMTSLTISGIPAGFEVRKTGLGINSWLSRARRCERVCGVLLAVVVLSVLDLALTLGCMMHSGMFEANPIVVQIARSTQSPMIIGVFKISTVMIGGSVLFRLRRHAQAELAAWLIALILCAVALQWINYLTLASGLPMIMPHDPAWVRLP